MPAFVTGWKREHRGHPIRRTTAGTYVPEVNRDGKRKRSTFATLGEAQAWIEAQERNRDEHGRISSIITAKQTRDALDALALLKAEGLNASLHESAEFFALHHKRSADAWTVAECLANYLRRMEEEKARRRSIGNKRVRLASFADKHGKQKVTQITATDVLTWLDETRAQGRHRRNFEIEIQSLFNFAASRMPGEYKNTVARFPSPPRGEIEPAEIVEPRHVAAVLHHLEAISPRAAVGWAVACFAGLRTAELARNGGVQWSDVDFERGEIVVRAALAKTRRERYVRIMPNLLAWLVKYRAEGCLALNEAGFHEWRMKACEALGITWPANGARHSFATYYGRLHNFRDAADMLGHAGGVGILEAHYKGKGDTDKARAYFEIKPMSSTAAAVIPYPANAIA